MKIILPSAHRHGNAGIRYEHQGFFWIGVAAVATGIGLQLPMYYESRMAHYRLAGMTIPPVMYLGMALLILGVLLAAWALFPSRLNSASGTARISIQTLDSAPIKRSHIGLLIVLTTALAIDAMKPITLSFVASGAAAEYGLRGPLDPDAHGLPIALYPLAGITGTVLGSFIWGWLGDRIGRRASILIAAVIFISSSTCGTMPAYWLNLLCCLYMGLGVGGMLPVALTLLSETVPARHRGWLMVFVGGVSAGAAYTITSWLAATIGAPDRFGWRILWLVGLPAGLVLILMNRWIPESPRFLLQQGRDQEAAAVLRRYGAVIAEDGPAPDDEAQLKGYVQLVTSPFAGIGACLVLLGIGIGLTQYGFQQWIPTNLQKMGYDTIGASTILRDAAFIGLPLSLPLAYFYGRWSSRWTITCMAALNIVSVAEFAIAGNHPDYPRAVLEVLLVIPIWSISGLAGVLAAYAVEIYPTKIRARGGSLSAGATKLGGVLILALAAAAAATPSIRTTAIVGLLPMVLAIFFLIVFGPETRRRPLEHIAKTQLETAANSDTRR